jgi:hypothetical protein
MSLTPYFHPLSSCCQKALVALCESDTPLVPHRGRGFEFRRASNLGQREGRGRRFASDAAHAR